MEYFPALVKNKVAEIKSIDKAGIISSTVSLWGIILRIVELYN